MIERLATCSKLRLSLSPPFSPFSISLPISVIRCALYLPAWFRITEQTLSRMAGGGQKKRQPDPDYSRRIHSWSIFHLQSHLFRNSARIYKSLASFNVLYQIPTKGNFHILICNLASIQQVKTPHFHVKSIHEARWCSGNTQKSYSGGSRFESRTDGPLYSFSLGPPGECWRIIYDHLPISFDAITTAVERG